MKGMLEWGEAIMALFTKERPNSDRPGIEKAEGNLDEITAEFQELTATAQISSADELTQEEEE
jgi:hypothetical protein